MRSEKKDIVAYSGGLVEKQENTVTHIQYDWTKLALALLTAAAAFSLYAINGLRFSKLSIGSFEVQAADTGDTVPETEVRKAAKRGGRWRKGGATAPLMEEFSKMADAEKRILRTLWHYQEKIYPKVNRLWTFKIRSDATEYPEYLLALGKLVKKDIVFVNPANGQCALKANGIRMMKSIVDDKDKDDYYHFPE
jgi:hypothetical protein